MVYTLKFDGCCYPNPGKMGIGAVILNDDNDKIIEISEKAGNGTNNQAEYLAIIRGLEELSKIYSGRLIIKGDSQLAIKQLKGEWKVKDKDLKPLFEKVKDLEEKFQSIEYNWINREENKMADALSARVLGLDLKKRKDSRIQLRPASSYEFVFDDDDKITLARDDRFNRDVKRYFILEAKENGKNISGTYFETGSKKLNELLNLYKPLKNKRFRIISTKAQNWVDYMVEELDV
jgi:ribonuclease HI